MTDLPGLERSVKGFETLTVTNSAGGPTAATAGSATAALFGPVETADVRWRADGTDPTSSVGHLLPTQQTLYVEGTDLINKIKFIRTGSTNAAIPASYFI